MAGRNGSDRDQDSNKRSNDPRLRDRIEEVAATLRECNSDEIQPRSFPARMVALYRDQGKNQDAICTALALLWLCPDITPFVMRRVLDGTFDLLKDYGIDPKPLWSFSSADSARRLLQAFFKNWPPESDPSENDIQKVYLEIEDGTLLGLNEKDVRLLNLEKLKNVSKFMLVSVIEKMTHERVLKLRKGSNSLRLTEIELFSDNLNKTMKKDRIARLFLGYPWFRHHPEAFEILFADEIVDTLSPICDGLGETGLHVVRQTGIEYTFVPRTVEFLTLGDVYGDCTASQVRSQVDPEIANINWTVCSWMLDPFYRIIRLLKDGEPVLKAHVFPLIVDGTPVFMIDAVEAVPKLRGERRNGSQNLARDNALYEIRLTLLDTLLDVCVDVARRMGIDTVWVEKFSNARWIRTRLEMLASETYELSDVEKPFETSLIEESIARALGRRSDPPKVETQARNTRLMHQNLLEGHKEVALLRGTRSSRRLRVSGP